MKRGAGGGSGLLPRLQRQESGRSGGAGAGGAPSHSERAAAHPVKAARLEDVLRSLLASMCHWLLLTFAGLQDAMLAIGSLRRVVAFALTPRCRAAVLHRLLPPGKNSATWESINYHVPEEARKLLLHGSLHALVHSPEVGIFCTVCVPLHGCLHSGLCLYQPARHTLPSVQVLHSNFSKQRLAAAELVTQRMLTDMFLTTNRLPARCQRWAASCCRQAHATPQSSSRPPPPRWPTSWAHPSWCGPASLAKPGLPVSDNHPHSNAG